MIRKGASDEGVSWFVYQLSSGGKALFWGSPNEGTRNIDTLKSQKLPCVIEINNPEDCVPSEYVAEKYGVSISIPEHGYIQVIPEL